MKGTAYRRSVGRLPAGSSPAGRPAQPTMTGGTLDRVEREACMPIAAGSSLDALMGPAVAFAVLAVLALFMRWAFGTGYGREKTRADRRRSPAASPDEGLLTTIATLSREESALALRAVLSDAGIRSTVRFPAPHRADVLVFPEDADRARALAASFPGPE